MFYPAILERGEGIIPFISSLFIYKPHVCVPLSQQELHDFYHRLNKQSDTDPVLFCIFPRQKAFRNLEVLESLKDSECV